MGLTAPAARAGASRFSAAGRFAVPVWLATLLAVAASSGFAAEPVAPIAVPKVASGEARLLAVERRRLDAQVAGDVATIEAALADDLVYIHGSGAVQTKEEYLGSLRAGGIRYRGIDLIEQSARVYGDFGITHGLLKLHVGADLEFVNRYTGVYARRAGRWLLVSWQTTDVKPAPDARPAAHRSDR